MQSSRARWLMLALPASLFLSWAIAAQDTNVAGESWADLDPQARFQQILGHIESSIAPKLIGAERWEHLVREHRTAIIESPDHRTFVDRVGLLLNATGVSHLHYWADSDWQLWLFRGGGYWADPIYSEFEHIGILPQRIDGEWFVRGILEDSVASRSDLRVGDLLVAVDGAPFHPVDSFRKKSGSNVVLIIERARGIRRTITIEPVRESLDAAWTKAISASFCVKEHGGMKQAYLHLWHLWGRFEFDKLEDMHAEVDGVILDFRDGFGGTDRTLGLLLAAWRKPVVILTSSDGTRSAKEIVALTARENNGAKLVGTRTAGAVLPCRFQPVGKDGLLVLPVQHNEQEGKPLNPDVFVDRDIRFCAGADPQLEKAREVLLEMHQAWPKSPESVTRSDGSIKASPLDDFNPERLLQLHRHDVYLAHLRSQTLVKSGDQIVFPGAVRELVVVSGDGTQVSRVEFPVMDLFIESASAVQTGNAQGWFVAGLSSPHTAAEDEEAFGSKGAFVRGPVGRPKPAACLYASDGARLWTFKPLLAPGQSGELHTAAGDLDGDSQAELVLGLSAYERFDQGSGPFGKRNERAYLTVLDLKGEVLSQVATKDNDIRALWLTEPSVAGQERFIMVASSSAIRRFEFVAGMQNGGSQAPEEK